MPGDFDLMEAQKAILYLDALSSSAKLVALAVFSFWSKKSPRPYPGMATLQRMTRLSKPTVMRAVKELVAADVVHVATDENVHSQRLVFDLEPVMKLDWSKSDTGQNDEAKPVKKRATTGKGRFTNEHQNGSRSTEGTQEGTQEKEPNFALHPQTQKPPSEKQPRGTINLRDHYVAEYERTRGVKPNFGGDWGRAMKNFGKLVADHGLDEAKGIVTRALEQPATATFTPAVEPWAIVRRANSLKGSGPQQAQRRGAPRVPVQQTGVDVFASVRSI